MARIILFPFLGVLLVLWVLGNTAFRIVQVLFALAGFVLLFMFGNFIVSKHLDN